MTDATPLTDAEMNAWLYDRATFGPEYEQALARKIFATITSLRSDLQRTREALEKAYPLCIGWAAHWKCDHGNFAPEHLETLDDCAKALGLDILPSKALTPPTGT